MLVVVVTTVIYSANKSALSKNLEISSSFTIYEIWYDFEIYIPSVATAITTFGISCS